MFQVNDRLADMQFGKVANECVRVNGATGILTTARDALAEQVALANQRQAALAVALFCAWTARSGSVW